MFAVQVCASNPAWAESPTWAPEDIRAGFRITGTSPAHQSPKLGIAVPGGEIPESGDPADPAIAGAVLIGATAAATLAGCASSPYCSFDGAPEALARGAAEGAVIAAAATILMGILNHSRLTEDDLRRIEENRTGPFFLSKAVSQSQRLSRAQSMM